jgi:Fe-S cluster assembly iron-binding protein IscA
MFEGHLTTFGILRYDVSRDILQNNGRGAQGKGSSVGKGEEEPPVIIMTEAAKRRFRTLRPEERAEGEALRLDRARSSVHEGGEPKLAVYLGVPEEGDDPVVHEGEPLLYVSRKVSAAFDGCVVDLVETPEGVGFSIGPPEAGGHARS